MLTHSLRACFFSGNEDYDNYSGDSLQNVFSSTKSLVSIVFATLVDRGLISYDDLVSDHWPEFIGGGKEQLRVCDVLRHEAGMVTLDQVISVFNASIAV